jgi:hypothetical protein
MIPAPPPNPAPSSLTSFVWGIQDWMNTQGVLTQRSNVYVASKDELTDSNGYTHGALSQPETNSHWYSPDAMGLMLSSHKGSPPPEYAVRIVIHESLHQQGMDEGLVESVAQDMTRKWYLLHAPKATPTYAEMGKYENITASRKATTVGGAWWNQASRLARRVLLVGKSQAVASIPAGPKPKPKPIKPIRVKRVPSKTAGRKGVAR